MQALALMGERNFHCFLPIITEKVKLIILERELISGCSHKLYNTGIKKYLWRFNLDNGKTADDAGVLWKLKLHQRGILCRAVQNVWMTAALKKKDLLYIPSEGYKRYFYTS